MHYFVLYVDTFGNTFFVFLFKNDALEAMSYQYLGFVEDIYLDIKKNYGLQLFLMNDMPNFGSYIDHYYF